MGTIIKATAISTTKTNNSSNEHAIDAGLQCVKAAGISKEDIDIIINVGVYRDKNMIEPAMAAFIQKGVGIKGDYAKKQGYNAVFSFDLMNSSCGIINAIQVADSILKTKNAKYALIASSDTHPSNKTDQGFPFSCIGAAMILEYTKDEKKGFENIIFSNSKNSDHSVRGYTDFSKTDDTARDRLTITVPDEYNAKILEFTSNSVNDYLASTKIDRNNLKLITPQICEGFGEKIAESAGINDNSIMDLYKEYGDAHSSALSMAYHLGSKNGQYKDNDRILFIASGAGLSSACALYNV